MALLNGYEWSVASEFGGPKEEYGLIVPGAPPSHQGDGSGPYPSESRVRRIPQTWSEVPWRTIIATIGVVAATALAAYVIYTVSRIVIWTLVAVFFAVILAPPVRWVERHLHLRRGAAVGVIVLVGVGLFIGLLAIFILPVRTQLTATLTDLPGTVSAAAEGKGPVGNIVSELHLESLVKENEPRIQDAIKRLESSSISLLGAVLETLLALVTISVITCLLLTQAPNLSKTAHGVIPERHREWVTSVAADAAKAVSGYMLGNLLISVFAGVAAFLFCLILGIPSPVVLAIWVAFADLIPLVGATLGAVVVIFAAFLHSPTAGIIAVIFFVAYQQFENSVLQVQIMARTVRVNPLAVILSVLLGVELFGFVGALLAIPAAGAMQVMIKELWRHRPREVDRLVVVGDESGESAHVDAGELVVRDRRRWRWPFRSAMAGPRKQS
jgi:predicted PurR-regulated permease PerM